MKRTGGELITQCLIRHGVGSVFSIAGASHSHLLDPLDRAGFTLVSSRHEAGAVGGADGYARASGKLGVALLVADQGLPNAVGALAVAFHAQSPVLILVATPPRIHVEAEVTIDQDKLALVSPVSRWARTVPDVTRLGDYLETAIKHANAPRQGPVVLLVPQEVLQAETPWQQVGDCTTAHPGLPNSDAIESAAKLLCSASRPLIIAGGGAAKSDCCDALADMSSRFGIPVFMNGLGRGQVPEDDQLGFSWPYAQVAAHKADIVIVVGGRLTQRLGLGLPPRFSATAKFVQIDNDPTSFHRNRPVHVPILGDAMQCLAALNDALSAALSPGAFDPSWVSEALRPRAQRIEELQAGETEAIHPLQLGQVIARQMDPRSIYVADGADIATWMYGAIRIKRRRGFMDHYPMGAMGSCTAIAVGAAAAEKESLGEDAPPVVLVTGDGAIGFHPAEIHAAVRAGLNLVVIVGNDGAWGTELHGQRQALGRDINTFLGQLPYEKLGEVFGASSIRIETSDQLEPGLDSAFSGAGVVVVNVLIDPEAGMELKINPNVQMILFSDILSGQVDLAEMPECSEVKQEKE